MWFDRLSLKPLRPERAVPPPTARASSEASGNGAALAIDGKTSTMWRSARTDASPQTLEIDLQAVREFGGIEIDWARGLHAPRYTIETSLDGSRWKKVRSVDAEQRRPRLAPDAGVGGALHPRDDAGSRSRCRHRRALRAGPGVRRLTERVHQFAGQAGAAAAAIRAPYLDEQIYWTIVGVDGDTEEGMLSEDGALEVRKGSYSIEPFVKTRAGWLTWADVAIGHSLADGYLPIPSVEWKHRSIELTTTAYASGQVGSATLHAIYRLRNPTQTRQQVTLALAVRPFQVNPPAQFLNTEGGVSRIHDLAFEKNRVTCRRSAGSVSAHSAPRVPRSHARRGYAVRLVADERRAARAFTTTAASRRVH